MNSKSEDKINITIKINNTKDNNLIITGKSYYFFMKRSSLIKNLFKEFTKNFNENQQKEIKKYKLFTKEKIQMKDNYDIHDYFNDKDETIFYEILI